MKILVIGFNAVAVIVLVGTPDTLPTTHGLGTWLAVVAIVVTMIVFRGDLFPKR